jgi:putative ABC transport system permease protein
MKNLFKDIRYGIRSLIRQPSFTIIAVLTLALGIGVNSAIFSVVNSLLLKALPFQNPAELVVVNPEASNGGLSGIAGYEYLAWKDNSKSFVQLAAYSNDNFNLTGRGEPERISCAQVTSSLFPLLGVKPLKGRTFLPDEDRPGNDRVAIVSERFWQSRYNSTSSLVGDVLTLNGTNYTVVGIMPKDFRFPGEYDIWVPLALDQQREIGEWFTLVQVVGRLKTNISAAQAQTELGLISKQATQQVKEPPPLSAKEVAPLKQNLVSNFRLTVLVLWGAVGLVLLIACANVASLMLARTVSRQREMAVRAAVGASRRTLIRQLLTESLVLGGAGGLLGVIISIWCIQAVTWIVPESFASSVYDLKQVHIDGPVLLFTLGISLITSVLFGLAPAISASKPNLVRSLRDGHNASVFHAGFRNARTWLVVAELAIAVILLFGAGLLTRSFGKLMSVNPGFDPQNVLTVRIDLPRSSYAKPEQTEQFYSELLQRLKSTPAIESVGAITHSPLADYGLVIFTGIEDQAPTDRTKEHPLGLGAVSDDYFRTLKIPLLSGRFNDATDTAKSNPVALVNEAFARRYFPSGNAVGKRVGFGCKEKPCRTIVGVVGDIKQESLTVAASPEIFVPMSQLAMNGMTLFVRTKAEPLSVAKTVRSEVLAIDKNQPIHRIQTLSQRIQETAADSRALMFLLGAFALLALLLATIGVYGIISYSVGQRTHEIGIRMALGARTADVMRLVMRKGLVLTVAGIGLGVVGSLALTRFLKSLLFGVTPTDKVTFVAVGLILLVAALLACLIPARRAAKVDPLVALKYE